MTIDQLNAAIAACNKGELNYRPRANYHCFRHGKNWYPIRAIVNHALGLTSPNDKTLNEAVLIMAAVLPALTVKEVDLTLHQAPVPLSKDEISRYTKQLITETYQLV